MIFCAQLDKSVLADIATGNPEAENSSLLLYWCEYDSLPVESNSTDVTGSTYAPLTTFVGTEECERSAQHPESSTRRHFIRKHFAAKFR